MLCESTGVGLSMGASRAENEAAVAAGRMAAAELVLPVILCIPGELGRKLLLVELKERDGEIVRMKDS